MRTGESELVMLGVDKMKGGLTRREPLNIRAEPRHDLLEMDVFLRDLWRGDECAFAAANCDQAAAHKILNRPANGNAADTESRNKAVLSRELVANL